jgi:predicted transposase YbfD/YdcC
MSEKNINFLDYFDNFEDPRIDRNKLYPMEEILLTTLSAVISGAEGWKDVENFGKAKSNFLRKYLPFENGIPSDDTFRRFFRAIDPKKFQQNFLNWVNALNIPKCKNIAIDGKTSRRSHDKDKKALHLISAFASESKIILGQKKVDGKTNEITEIPELLDWLDLEEAIVTIDAMGCQTKIASQIVNQGGDYVLALKGNQSNLHDELINYFEQAKEYGTEGEEYQFFEEKNKGHGRIEKRKIYVTDKINFLPQKNEWNKLKSIVCISSERTVGDKKSKENRYYITSLSSIPQKISKVIKDHWAIENSLHWVLDVSFGEDQSRIRKGNGPENMSIMRHCAINMIRKYKSKRQSIKGLRKQAAWDEGILEGILDMAS